MTIAITVSFKLTGFYHLYFYDFHENTFPVNMGKYLVSGAFSMQL